MNDDDDDNASTITAPVSPLHDASSSLALWGMGGGNSTINKNRHRHSSSGGGGGGSGSHTQQHHHHHQHSRSHSQQQPGEKSGSSTSSEEQQQLHLTMKVQLGDQDPQTLKPVPLNPDGSADVCQAAVFAVLRPLEEAIITYHLGLGRGPRGPPLLVLVFQYSLLHMLRRSPKHSFVWEDWRAVARATVSGLQVCVYVCMY